MKACSHSNLHDTERLEAGGARSERALGACTGAKRGCTCQRRCDSWTLDRREDCGKGRVACGKGRIAGRCFQKCEPHFVARTCAGPNLQWNNDNSSCERLLCDARWADVTGASGRRTQECACSTDGKRWLAPRSNSGRTRAAGDTGWNSKTLNGLQTVSMAKPRS